MQKRLIFMVVLTFLASCSNTTSHGVDTDVGSDIQYRDANDARDSGVPDTVDTRDVAGPDMAVSDVSDITGDTGQTLKPTGPARFVNPFIGTGGKGANIGSAFVGAALPFSLAKPGPDTREKYGAIKQFHCSGYWYEDKMLTGFSQLHVHGTGASDYGALALLPVPGKDSDTYMAGKFFPLFSHKNETAFPGYYGVVLDNGVRAEMTTTGKAALHRYTFLPAMDAWVGIDTGHALPDCTVQNAQAFADKARRLVTGSLLYKGSLSGRNNGFMLYFAILFDRPFDKVRQNNTAPGSAPRLLLHFPDASSVVARVGISMVDAQGAMTNLGQARSLAFDTAVNMAVDAWNRYLGVVELKDPGDVDPVIFYTSLYHALLMPDDLADLDGRYTGFDGKVHQGSNFFSDFSGWDTFRTVHPMDCLLYPDDQARMLNSLELIMEQGGYIPNWPIAHGYGNSMFGNPGVIIMADSYLRGFHGFDATKALKNMVSIANGARGNGFSGRDGAQDLLKFHYIPADKHKGSVSKTLEDSLADFCVSRLADALHDTQTAQEFQKRSNYWKNIYDPVTGFFRPKDSSGHFLEPFHPTYLEDQGAYTEGTAWQYLFDVPQDVQGLAQLLGGTDKFIGKLNEFFEKSGLKITPYFDSYYWHGNEPDLPAPFLFVDAGQGKYTDKWIRKIMAGCYANRPDGLAGNDDAGTLGAWYVWGALGLFPRYCKGDFWLFSPVVKKAVLHLKAGDLTIQRGNGFSFDGKALAKPVITQEQLSKGGTLILPNPR